MFNLHTINLLDEKLKYLFNLFKQNSNEYAYRYKLETYYNENNYRIDWWQWKAKILDVFPFPNNMNSKADKYAFIEKVCIKIIDGQEPSIDWININQNEEKNVSLRPDRNDKTNTLERKVETLQSQIETLQIQLKALQIQNKHLKQKNQYVSSANQSATISNRSLKYENEQLQHNIDAIIYTNIAFQETDIYTKNPNIVEVEPITTLDMQSDWENDASDYDETATKSSISAMEDVDYPSSVSEENACIGDSDSVGTGVNSEEQQWSPKIDKCYSNQLWQLKPPKTNIKDFAEKKISTLYHGKFNDQISGPKAGPKSEIAISKLYTDFETLQFVLAKCLTEKNAFLNAKEEDEATGDDNERTNNHNNVKYELINKLKQFYHYKTSLIILNEYGHMVHKKNEVNIKMILTPSITAAFYVAKTFPNNGMMLTTNNQYVCLGAYGACSNFCSSSLEMEKDFLNHLMTPRLIQGISINLRVLCAIQKIKVDEYIKKKKTEKENQDNNNQNKCNSKLRAEAQVFQPNSTDFRSTLATVKQIMENYTANTNNLDFESAHAEFKRCIQQSISDKIIGNLTEAQKGRLICGYSRINFMERSQSDTIVMIFWYFGHVMYTRKKLIDFGSSMMAGSVYASKTFTDTLKNRISERFIDAKALYYYINHITEVYEFIAINNKKEKIFLCNNDLHDKNGLNIFLIIKANRNFCNPNSNQWRKKFEEAMNKHQIWYQYGIQSKQLPESSRSTEEYKTKLEQLRKTVIPRTIINDNINWSKIHRCNSKRKKDISITITKERWNECCKSSIDVHNKQLNPPIITKIIKRREQWLEIMIPIKISEIYCCALALKHIQPKWIIQSICLDKRDIYNKCKLNDPTNNPLADLFNSGTVSIDDVKIIMDKKIGCAHCKKRKEHITKLQNTLKGKNEEIFKLKHLIDQYQMKTQILICNKNAKK
eukprot:392695_1